MWLRMPPSARVHAVTLPPCVASWYRGTDKDIKDDYTRQIQDLASK
jgi:hypothetical protein